MPRTLQEERDAAVKTLALLVSIISDLPHAPSLNSALEIAGVLESARKFLRSLALPNGVHVTDRGGGIVTTNAFWECLCPDNSAAHIHNAYEEACVVCGEKRDMSPECNVKLLRKWLHRYLLDQVLLSETMEKCPPMVTPGYEAFVRLLLATDDEGAACDAVSALLSEHTMDVTPNSCLMDWGYVENKTPQPTEIALPYAEGDFMEEPTDDSDAAGVLAEIVDVYESLLCSCGDEDDEDHQDRVARARQALRSMRTAKE